MSVTQCNPPVPSAAATPRRSRLHGWLARTAACSAAALVFASLTGTPAHAADTLTLTSGDLSVVVGAESPRVVSTTAASGASLDGRAEPLTTLVINGEEYGFEATSARTSESVVSYRITVPDLPGVVVDAELRVEGSTVTFEVTGLTDTAEHPVSSMGIPDHDLVSVSSDDPGATIAAANLSVDREKSGDQFIKVTDELPTAEDPTGSAYLLANTDELAVAFESNSMYVDQSKANDERNRFQRRAVADDGEVRVGMSSGNWTIRGPGADEREELPKVTFAVTGDANGDEAVTWQDAAIALRSIHHRPFRAEEVADRVITHIPFNFASQATHPFLRTLDDVKRIALATDGLGQLAMLKGYTSEGHDSANSDYGGNYNTRAGGLRDLNKLAAGAEKWNTTIGVHINATEMYPEAHSFNDRIVQGRSPGWNWLDQSYYVDQVYDTNSGSLARRIAQLREETHPNLSFVYVDVYYKYGWLAHEIQSELVANGFQVGTEWADKFNQESTWSHWASDENYGGTSNKGINSRIIRFVEHTDRDVWNPHPLLGNAQIAGFEGWSGQNDWYAFLHKVWRQNVPAKFLQHHTIQRWTDDRIDLSDDVSVFRTDEHDRVITIGGKEVLRDETYLLPWGTGDERRLYHWNEAGGRTTWELPGEWADLDRLTVYALTDNGRVRRGAVPVRNGTVMLRARPDTAYVLTPTQQGHLPTPTWGAGTPVVDPGFNGTDLDPWQPTDNVRQVTMDKGQRVAEFRGGRGHIGQQLGALDEGTYSISAWVEIEHGRSRKVTLTGEVPGAEPVSRTITTSPAKNKVGADEKHDTYFQRIRVLVDVPADGVRPTMTLSVGAGRARVRVDDIRVVDTSHVPTEADEVVAEDFEDVDFGWGPFVKGGAGGSNDPRTHLSERHDPYTSSEWGESPVDDVLGGDWSLKSNGENTGLVYRTWPGTVTFEPGHRYRVSFDHQSSAAGGYTWVSGYDGSQGPVITGSTPIGEQTSTERFSNEFVAGHCGTAFVGLQKTDGPRSIMVLDNLSIVDLGAATEVPACATLGVAAGFDVVEPGSTQTVTTTLTIDEPETVTDVEVRLEVPEGWTVEPVSVTRPSLEPGERLETQWKVTSPADADGDYEFTATATYTATEPEGTRTVTTTLPVRTVPAPPQGVVWASDHPFVSQDNGWGPAERDTSNGGRDAGDGSPLTLQGTVYEKGIGAHADSTIRFYLGGQCRRFTATVGVDDSQGTRGSVVFSVVGDGTTLATSPVQRGGGTPTELDVDVTGVRYLDLVLDTTEDGNGNDHGDWAAAQFSCNGG